MLHKDPILLSIIEKNCFKYVHNNQNNKFQKKLTGYISIHETRKTITRIYKCQMKQEKEIFLKKVHCYFPDVTRTNQSPDNCCLLSVNIQHIVCLCKYLNDDPRRIRKYLLIYCGLTLSHIRQP